MIGIGTRVQYIEHRLLPCTTKDSGIIVAYLVPGMRGTVVEKTLNLQNRVGSLVRWDVAPDKLGGCQDSYLEPLSALLLLAEVAE